MLIGPTVTCQRPKLAVPVVDLPQIYLQVIVLSFERTRWQAILPYQEAGFDVFIREFDLEAFNNVFDPLQFIDIPVQRPVELNHVIAQVQVVQYLLGGRDLLVDRVFPLHLGEFFL